MLCVCVCVYCHLYATGGAVRELEFVLSSAACFCFLRITSWSFCFTRELATAPVNHITNIQSQTINHSPTAQPQKEEQGKERAQ